MLGKHYLTFEELHDPRHIRADVHPGLGATAVEWGTRIRTGGFTIAGLALGAAFLMWAWPAIRIAMTGRRVYRKVRKVKAAAEGAS